MRNMKSPLICVDDDEDDRMLLQEVMEDLFPNLDLRLLENGIGLIELILQDIANLPRLILLDLNMPGKNGFECLKEIRSSNPLKSIPVIIYSTSSSPIDRERSLQLGANRFLTKSSSFQAMRDQLSVVINDYLK